MAAPLSEIIWRENQIPSRLRSKHLAILDTLVNSTGAFIWDATPENRGEALRLLMQSFPYTPTDLSRRGNPRTYKL